MNHLADVVVLGASGFFVQRTQEAKIAKQFLDKMQARVFPRKHKVNILGLS